MALPDNDMGQSMSLFGVAISDLSRETALDRLERAIRLKQHLKLAFCNAHTANLAYSDPKLKSVLSEFIVLADGLGVDIAARILYGRPFAANLNGTDFVPALLAHSTQPLRIAMLGSAPGVAARASDVLKKNFTHHVFDNVQHGFATAEETELFLQSLKQAPVDILLVAMGNPRQEEFIAQRITAEHATLAIGVGALFDFIAGEVPRAPLWVRSLRMEWLFRLLQEPKRLFERYVLGNPLFLFRVLKTRMGLGKPL
ncbi:MAG: WecB/TagA/CpsF family glycosyltransferase [Beijerinckiaceae bacterium]